MNQFSDFTFMQSLDLGTKANMSYRLRSLFNEQIELAQYGNAVQSILISPLIGSILSPQSAYKSEQKRLIVEFEIPVEKALNLDEAAYFKLMLHSFIKAIQKMDLPSDFNFKTFQKDLKALRFEQLQQTA